MKHYFFPTLTGIEAMTQGDSDVPRLGHGQLLVRMHAASINFRDLLVARGGYRGSIEKDLIPLSDGAGEIVEVDDVARRNDDTPRRGQCAWRTIAGHADPISPIR